jgi:hypothetical protein
MPCHVIHVRSKASYGGMVAALPRTAPPSNEEQLRTLAAATSFMASVIFMVFFTDAMRSRTSLRPAVTCRWHAASATGHAE